MSITKGRGRHEWAEEGHISQRGLKRAEEENETADQGIAE
jgi:hypothetical protein